MPELAPDQAVAAASAALASTEPALAARVERLDHADRAYYLIIFGPEAASTAVAAVEAATGVVMSSAKLGGQHPHLSVTRQRALEIAALGDHADARLVWRPCAASRSPLYPIWRVSGPGETIFVNQQQQRWDDLADARA